VLSAAWLAPHHHGGSSSRRLAAIKTTAKKGPKRDDHNEESFSTQKRWSLFQNSCDGDEDTAKIVSDEESIPISTRTTTRRRDVVIHGLTLAAPAIFWLPLLLSSFPEASMATAETRCDPSDRRCGPDGKLRNNDELLSTTKPIPKVTNRITHVVQLVIYVGERREETGAIRFGLYGEDCPANTRRMLEFLTTRGITGPLKPTKEDDIGLKSAPVSLLEGGIVPNICSGTAVDFGVPSQAKAYAQSRGLVKAGDNFVPQSRPFSDALELEPFPRPHNVAGLISVPLKGIGYGGDVSFLSDDEAFLSAFLITADAAPTLDKDKDNKSSSRRRRRVIGQVIDDDSMKFLNRLATLPTQKKGLIKEVIPGESSGPPLLKVTIRDIGVQKVPPTSQQKS
jgi:hypothetical protein